MALIGDSNIIQVRYHSSTSLQSRSSGTYGEVYAGYRCSITPKRSDSKIIVQCTGTYSSAEEHRLVMWKLRNMTQNYDLEVGASSSGRAQSVATTRGSYNVDCAEGFVLTAIDNPGSTSSQAYGFHLKTHASYWTKINHSQNATDTGVHWTSVMMWQLWEVEDI